MTMKKIYFALAVSFVVSSCKNELKVITDWKETTVVYGLLNQSDTAQYIKINKAFLGEGNALQMAQVSDSSTYGNHLNVTLVRYKNGNNVQTITLQRDSSIPKQFGTFYAPDQVLYKTKSVLFDDSEYKLNILNTKTNNAVSGKTVLVKDFSISNPQAGSGSINFTNPSFPYNVAWTSAVNGRLYGLVIRFHYIERLKSDTSQKTSKYVDWNFGTLKSKDLAGGEVMEQKFLGSDFYQFLRSVISPNNNYYRYVGALDFMFSVAGDDFNTYMEINQPSTSIVQEKPEYSNIENGIGILSSRYTKIIPNKLLNQKSEDSIYAGQYTYNLGFCSPSQVSTYKCF